MNYPERMRALREDNGLTQTDIAKMLGIAQTTYSQYELYKRPMPIEYLVALCKYYEVSADYMLGLTEKK
ncbi:MAG: helix-turn-helix transcriptional regulator [Ruminococcus sp.]|jgi:transcriptional regulator with XRE-family HTH domain|nr:helix-turn-helix transcriptional regulator [Ruminococcus sp.]